MPYLILNDISDVGGATNRELSSSLPYENNSLRTQASPAIRYGQRRGGRPSLYSYEDCWTEVNPELPQRLQIK
jgi:hypothetical protein